nr:retrovirus-related Pol polyprotein from transposon TNT 1-94 [Tanacetum cinerariifolium]
MSTQQDIYVVGSESRPYMLNKENYVPWSSCLLRYAKSRPNGKIIYNSIMNGPYVRRMISKPCDADHQVPINETFHEQTDDELTEKELKQTKDLHITDYTQLYDFLKYNQKEVDELKAERLAKIQDPLALMANSKNPYASLAPHQDLSSFNQNYLQHQIPNLEDITDPTTAMNMALALIAKAFKLNYSTQTNNNQRISSNPNNRQIAQPGMNISQDRQMQMIGEEYDLMATAADLDEIEEVNANCILMANLQQASSSGTQTDSTPVYDSDGSAKFMGTIRFGNDHVAAIMGFGDLQWGNILITRLGDLKGKSKDTSCVSDTRNLLSQKLENKNVELEFQVLNYTRENAHLKATYKNLFDSIYVSLGKTNALSNPVTSNSVSTPQEPKSVNNDKVIAPGMFRINPSKTSREEKHSSRSNNKEAKVEEQHRNLLLYKNNKHISSACNNIKTDSQEVISNVVYAMCSKCLIFVNHDKCLCNHVNDKNSRGKKQKAKVSVKEIQKKYQPKVSKPKKVEHRKSLATPMPRKSRLLLRWSPTGKLFDKDGKILIPVNPRVILSASMKFMGTVCFGNDHVDAILGFGDLQWGNILITRVYFVEGLGYNLFFVGQFCDFDLEVAFRRNACFIRNLEGVDLLKVDRSTNLYIINFNEMASTSPICLMARTSSTKSWLWHQRLSHLNFDTINDLARNDLAAGLPKFKYNKEHLCPSCEQGKSKRASHPPKPVPNSRQRLHLFHMDLCGPMRIASINGKRIQQYLQNEHYALWEVIEFGDSYKAPLEESDKGPASESSAKKKGRTVVITTEDMQKRRNDTFGENEATKKTKKNQLKQQYGNFKAEGSETLEQTFNKLQAIVSHLEFMDVEIEQDDLNQKFLTSLAPEWLMYTIVWRNRDDLDTMSLDDVYNHLKVYEPRIKYKDITQIDKDDIEEIDIKWNMDLLSMRAYRFWKKTGKKITIQGSDVAGPKEEEPAPKALMAIDGIGWDWSYMANEEENHAGVADDEVPTEYALMAKSSLSLKNKVYDDSYCSKSCRKNTKNLNTKISKLNEQLSDCETDLYHYKRGLSHVEARLVEFKEQEIKFCEKIRGLERDVEVRNNKIEYLMNELEQEVKDQIRIRRLLNTLQFLPPAQVYSPPKKDLSWTADCPRVTKTNDTENARKSTIKYAEMYRNTTKSPKVREKGEFWPKNNYAHKNVTPRAVLLKTSRTPVALNRPNMNVAQPKMTSFAKTAHSNVKRPFQGESAVRTQPRVPRVSTITKKFLTVNLKIPTVKSTLTANLGNKGKAVKASACWI